MTMETLSEFPDERNDLADTDLCSALGIVISNSAPETSEREQVLAGMRRDRDLQECASARSTMDHLIDRYQEGAALPSIRRQVSASVIVLELGIPQIAEKRCKKLISKWGRHFVLDENPSVVRDGEIVQLQTAPVLLERFLAEREGGEPLFQSRVKPGTACLTSISLEIGLAYASVRQYQHLVVDAIETGRVKLGGKPPRNNEDAQALREARAECLAFVDRCIDEGVALPTNPNNRKAYDFQAVVRLAGIHDDKLALDQQLHQQVYKRAPLLEHPPEIMPPGTTYGQFEEELRRARSEEVVGLKSASAQVSQTMQALKQYRTAMGRTQPGAMIGDELLPASVEEAIPRILASGRIKNPGLFKTNIKIVARIHQKITSDDGLGDDIGGAIAIAIHRSGKSLTEISKETGISMASLHNVRHLRKYTKADLEEHLEKLETALSVRAGRFLELAKHAKRPFRMEKGERKVSFPLKDFVSDRWREMDDQEFDEMVAWITDNILQQPTPYGAAMRQAVKLGRESARVRKELGAERRIGSELDEDKKPPFQKSLEQLVVVKMQQFSDDDHLRSKGSYWVDHTARMRMGMLLDLANFATDPPEAGGLGFDPEVFDLAHLLNTEIPKAYVDELAHRLADVEWEDENGGKKRGPLLTAHHADLMILLASIFREKWGFAYQKPELAKAIDKPDTRPLPAVRYLVKSDEVQKVLPGYSPPAQRPKPFVPEHLVDLDPAAYRDECAKAADRYDILASEIAARSKRSRDPIATIKGLVHDDQPIRTALEHIKLAIDRAPSLASDPVAHHLHIRDCTGSIFAILTAFRPKNFREVTIDGPAPQLKCQDGRFKLEIPHDRFKNWKSAPLFADRSPYLRTLPHIAAFQELMEYYIAESRPFLLGDRDTPNLFLDGKGLALTGLSHWRMTRDFTARHLAFNPYKDRGIPDVLPFSPYSWRYIVATDILVNAARYSNPYLAAANALQTSEAMILRYYARVRPDARNELVDKRMEQVGEEVWGTRS